MQKKITNSNNSEFLKKLQAEAHAQAELSRHRFLPAQLDWITSFVGRYSWQVITIISGCTAFGLELWKHL